MLCLLESSDGTFNQVPSNAYIPVLGHLSEVCLVRQRLEEIRVTNGHPSPAWF